MTSSCLTLTISVYSWRPEKFDDLSEELDACLARHAHACTRVMASRTARKIGGSRCRRERSRRMRGEGGKAPMVAATGRGRGEGEAGEEASKRGPLRRRLPWERGEASRPTRALQPARGPTETATVRAPWSRGPAARARARDRDNDRREPHTRLAHVRAARAVNTNRVFFILGATSLPPSFSSSSSSSSSSSFFSASSSCCCSRAVGLLLVFPSLFLETPLLPRIPLARGDFALLSCFFITVSLPRRGFAIFYCAILKDIKKQSSVFAKRSIHYVTLTIFLSFFNVIYI